MPFFGFLGGVVLTALVVVLLSENRRCRTAGRSLDWMLLPWTAYALVALYVALFFIMWAYYFDGDLARMQAEFPNADLNHVVRGYLFQLERGDFIITLLAFLAGVLIIVVLLKSRRAEDDQAAPPDPKTPQNDAKAPDQGGVGSVAMRQMRRITALNSLLVFVLFLFTLPALLPWVERRLSIVKFGDFEAHLVPLPDKARGSSSPDTPSLYANKHLGRWLMISASIVRAIKVLESAPELIESKEVSFSKTRFNYEETNRLFVEKIIPQVARLYCMSVLAGVEPATVPGVREASSAFMTALQNHAATEIGAEEEAEVVNNIMKSFRSALLHLSLIENHYNKYYSHLNSRCQNELNSAYSAAGTFNEMLSYKSIKHEHRRGPHGIGWSCLNEKSLKRCYHIVGNGYTIRLITELAKIAGGKEANSIHLMLVEDGWLSRYKYEKYGLTKIDHANLQIVKLGYMTDLHYSAKDIIREYIDMKDIAIEIVTAISTPCGSCSGERKPKPGMKDEFEAYRRNAVWYVDSDAVVQIGATMLRRLSLNKLDETDKVALRTLLNSAIRSRDEMHRGLRQVPESTAENDRWAVAMLDEGIATIRYVQLIEAPDTPRDEQLSICASARFRLEGAVGAYDKLSVSSPEHRFNHMRAERTLALVNQYCGEP